VIKIIKRKNTTSNSPTPPCYKNLAKFTKSSRYKYKGRSINKLQNSVIPLVF